MFLFQCCALCRFHIAKGSGRKHMQSNCILCIRFVLSGSPNSLPHRSSYGSVTQSFLSHVCGTGTRDEPLRMSVLEAKVQTNAGYINATHA